MSFTCMQKEMVAKQARATPLQCFKSGHYILSHHTLLKMVMFLGTLSGLLVSSF